MKLKPFRNIFENRPEKEKTKEEKIIIDFREKNSLVPSEIIKLGLKIEFSNLEVGDYIVKEKIIERKTYSDFYSSIINRRLFFQLNELKRFENSLIIIEGFETENNKNQIRGAILSIVLNYKIPIIFTKSERETAEYLSILSKKQKKEISLNPKKTGLTKKQELEYILESFPGIGTKNSKKLLEEFHTLKSIVNSNSEKLKEIIGKKSESFKEIIEREY